MGFELSRSLRKEGGERGRSEAFIYGWPLTRSPFPKIHFRPGKRPKVETLHFIPRSLTQKLNLEWHVQREEWPDPNLLAGVLQPFWDLKSVEDINQWKKEVTKFRRSLLPGLNCILRILLLLPSCSSGFKTGNGMEPSMNWAHGANTCAVFFPFLFGLNVPEVGRGEFLKLRSALVLPVSFPWIFKYGGGGEKWKEGVERMEEKNCSFFLFARTVIVSKRRWDWCAVLDPLGSLPNRQAVEIIFLTFKC